MTRLLLILTLQEADLALALCEFQVALSRSPSVSVKVRFLDLVRRSEGDPFAIDFDTPGGRSGSVSSRRLCEGRQVGL